MKFVAKNQRIERSSSVEPKRQFHVNSNNNQNTNNNEVDHQEKSDTKTKSHDCKVCKDGKKIYVRAGSIGGNGTKQTPYNNLTQAQNSHKWTTLVIYYSSLPLDGGISLRNGQRIIGKGLDKPIITNTSMTTNEGYGIVVENGSVCIQNIHIDTTQNSAVNYDAAINICLVDVEITQANQAMLTLPIGNSFNLPGTNNVESASITGQNSNNGVTQLIRVTVTDGFTGPGVYDAPYGGAKRWLYVLDSEFARMRTVLPPSAPTLMVAAVGIFTAAFEDDTKHYVTIEGNSIHDFVNSPNSAEAFGINVVTFNGAKGYYKIKKNKIYGLITATNGVGSATYINGTTSSLLSNIESSYSESTAHITSNILTHVAFPAVYYDGTAIEWSTFNGQTKTTIKKNVIQNMLNDIQTIHGAKANTEFVIEENVATAGNSFYTFSAVTFPPEPTDQVFLNNKVFINNNTFNGGIGAGAISTSGTFNRCIVELKANCFDGTYDNHTGTAAITSVGPGPSGVQFIGHYNNFTNYAIDINDLGGNSTYYLQKNWWGSPNGVTNNVPPSTSVIDLNRPLKSPIVCQLLCQKDQEQKNDQEQNQRNVVNAKFKAMGYEDPSFEVKSHDKKIVIDQQELKMRISETITYFRRIQQKITNRW